MNGFHAMKRFIFFYCLLLTAFMLILTASCSENESFETSQSNNAGFSDPLSLRERAWLNEHPVITVAPDPDFPPVEFYKNNQIMGIAPDYLTAIGEKLGVEFRYIELDSWDAVMEEIAAHRVDMLSAASPSGQRVKFLKFTEPHTILPGILINRHGTDATLTMQQLKGLRVGTVSGYVWQDFIEDEYPEIELTLLPDIKTGLRMVSFAELDVFVIDPATASYAIEKTGFSNLHQAGETGWYTSLAFATWDNTLNRILEKGFAMLSREERSDIHRRWIHIAKPEAFWFNHEFWKITLLTLIFLILSFLVVIVWNRSLRHEVTLRTRGLENALRKRLLLEKQLRRSQKMEAVGQLAGGIAHDFNNILQAIIGTISLAKLDLSPGHTQWNHLDDIEKAALKAADLTKQLLTFGGRQTLTKTNLNLSSLATNLLKMVTRVIGETIRIEFISDPNLWCIHADRSQIEQVIMNLCVNAKDSMPDGGLLKLEIKNVSMDQHYVQNLPWAREGEFVLLSISDSGHGMDKETLSRIFEPFYTTKNLTKGTGLGLAMVHGIISQHHGMINVTTAPKAGTTFDIYLPATKNSQSSGMPPTLQNMVSNHGTETILIAEDEDAVRAILEKSLQMAGYKILSANSGTAALKHLSVHHNCISVAVLDVVMPEITGPQVAEIIQKKYSSIPVVFMTGYSHNKLQQEKLANRNFTVLVKPFHPRELLDTIRNVIDSKTEISP